MIRRLLLTAFLVGCGANNSQTTVPKISGSNLVSEASGQDSGPRASNYITCVAQKYGSSGWIELGKFRSPPEPYVNNGELLQNAEFRSGPVAFSSAGNFEEGLIYFGSIYDYEQRSGTQIQLAKTETIDLYLFQDDIQYNLSCKMASD